MNNVFLPPGLSRSDGGDLTFAGQSVSALADRYGTPLYLYDEARIRENCRLFLREMRESFPSGSRPLYAGKAASFRQIYRVMREEGMGIDVVSSGEIHTAASVDYPMDSAFFHGNSKTDEEIAFAMDRSVGYFVVDNPEELLAVDRAAARRGIRQKILLRITPGVDPHTYAAVNTGCVDSKFGNSIETGMADEILGLALSLPHVALVGFHCHVGSQVFYEDVFETCARIMLGFCRDAEKRHGYRAALLDLGGGYGVRYVESDPEVDLSAKLRSLGRTVREYSAALGIPAPAILLEPGRAIVADAGLTVYTVGAVKRIPGYKTYVSVDGGMTDNPRFALYKSRYTCLPAKESGTGAPMRCDVVGRCCESGDIIAQDVLLPSGIARGERIAVCTTGAYNFSMSSRYNRFPRPPVVMLRDGESCVAVRRETPETVAENDL